MENKGAVNKYICVGCKKTIFTINMNTGTTPALIGCKNCDKMMQSEGYRLNDTRVGIYQCWYRPTVDEYTQSGRDMQEHILMGGLLLGYLDCVHLVENNKIPEKDVDWLSYIHATYQPDSKLFEAVKGRILHQS